MNKIIVGIDLGTTNSAIALRKDGNSVIIPNKEGNNTTPSIVAYTGDQILVGESAKNQAASNAKRTITSVKRILGQRIKKLPEHAKKASYEIVGTPDSPAFIRIDSETVAPHTVSAKILENLKGFAEDYLSQEIKQAVITVPAYFNNDQRSMTKKAGEDAGLEVLRIINEPTAAALAYGFADSEEEKTILVFDLGGGTFDVSLLEMQKIDDEKSIEVEATSGDTFLGGDDFDREIKKLLISSYEKTTGLSLEKEAGANQRLNEAATQLKCKLSDNLEASVTLSKLLPEQELPFEFSLTRNKFEKLIDKYIKRIQACCKQVLQDTNKSISDVDEILMVGGSTRVPAVRQFVRDFFGKEPNTSVNPDEVVALGAAVQASILSGETKDIRLFDVTPLSLGIEVEDDGFDALIKRNTPIPCSAKDIYTTTDDDQNEVDIFILQGESEYASQNRALAQFTLSDIEDAPAEEPQIEVRFKINVDGILEVSATNRNTGERQEIVVKNSLEEQAEEYLSPEDLISSAQEILEETNNLLEEIDIDEEIKEEIIKVKKVLETALKSQDLENVELSLDTLTDLWDAILD